MIYKLKLKRPAKKGLAKNVTKSSLYCRFGKNGSEFKFYTGKSIDSKNWSEERQEVKKEEPNYKDLNLYLKTWLNDLDRIVLETETKKESLDQTEIKTKMDAIFKKDKRKQNVDSEIVDFISFFDDYLKRKKCNKRVTNKLQLVRRLVIINNKLASIKNIENYEKLSNKKKTNIFLQSEKPLNFNKIDLDFIVEFRNFLFDKTYTRIENGVPITKHHTVNYIDKQITLLKEVVTAAMNHKNKYVAYFSWDSEKSLKNIRNEADTVYIDPNEMQKIWDVELNDELEKQVRDKFIFNCYFGMRYGDLNSIDSHLFTSINDNGEKRIMFKIRTKKVDVPIEFLIHTTAVEILEKYNCQLPKINQNKFNKVIKFVAYKAGLTNIERIRETRGNNKTFIDVPKYQLISSHTGRRSFCTNAYQANKTNIKAIMAISGHTSEKEFLNYVKDKTISTEEKRSVIDSLPAMKPKLRK